MAHPRITWYCASCGYNRSETHTCPPDPRATIDSLVDALPTNAPSPDVRKEIKLLSDLLRQFQPDAMNASAGTIRWLLAAFSYQQNAEEKLRPYTAEAMAQSNRKEQP